VKARVCSPRIFDPVIDEHTERWQYQILEHRHDIEERVATFGSAQRPDQAETDQGLRPG